MNALPQEEFCPRCGVWVTQLDDYTGWCEPCATSVPATTVDSKRCSRCNVCREISQFALMRTGADGHRGVCRPCETAARKQWRLDHPKAERENSLRFQARRRWGRCPECGQKKALTISSSVVTHSRSKRPGAQRCGGSGQPPQEASTT